MFEELIKAIEKNNTRNAREIIKKMSVSALDQTDNQGRNALHIAVINKNIVIVKDLRLKMSDLAQNSLDKNNNSALNYASFTGNEELIKAVFGSGYHDYTNGAVILNNRDNINKFSLKDIFIPKVDPKTRKLTFEPIDWKSDIFKDYSNKLKCEEGKNLIQEAGNSYIKSNNGLFSPLSSSGASSPSTDKTSSTSLSSSGPQSPAPIKVETPITYESLGFNPPVNFKPAGKNKLIGKNPVEKVIYKTFTNEHNEESTLLYSLMENPIDSGISLIGNEGKFIKENHGDQIYGYDTGEY